jgi:glycopeptide antibiotics resistance protein
MIQALIRALLRRSYAGDDRAATAVNGPPVDGSPTGPEPALLEPKPPVLRRRTISLIAILGIAVILYGTLMPFQIDHSRSLSWNLKWYPPMTGDAVSNVLIYVPIGAFLRLVLRRRGSWRITEWAASLVIAGALSYLTEVAQTVIVLRVASWTDTLCNFGGAMVGIALGPALQRMLRNVHAWLYQELRVRPMSMAAATALLCVCTYALAPLDIKPTPRHVGQAIEHLRALPAHWVWLPGEGGLKPMAVMDKMAAAGSYGLLAFVLLLSAREAGRSLASASWYALSRSAALALAVEGVQLFTISHSADPRDLVSAWLCCLLGCLVGWRIVSRSPTIHQAPLTLLQGIVAVAAGMMLAWSVGSVVLSRSPTAGQEPMTWWPAIGSFHRSWNSLLGGYTTGLLEYLLVAGLLVLWCRSTRRRPRRALVVGTTLAIAAAAIGIARYRGWNGDTAHLLLALLAGVIAIRFDRAIFGKRGILSNASAGEGLGTMQVTPGTTQIPCSVGPPSSPADGRLVTGQPVVPS